ncbi:MAG: hypothetical protein AAGD96_23295, partial [Chloroflexota bacterium]
MKFPEPAQDPAEKDQQAQQTESLQSGDSESVSTNSTAFSIPKDSESAKTAADPQKPVHTPDNREADHQKSKQNFVNDLFQTPVA